MKIAHIIESLIVLLCLIELISFLMPINHGIFENLMRASKVLLFYRIIKYHKFSV